MPRIRLLVQVVPVHVQQLREASKCGWDPTFTFACHDPTVTTIQQICAPIRDRYLKIYPERRHEPLLIKKLQDRFFSDVDLSDTISDIFDDGDVLYVIQGRSIREMSIQPESSLRPYISGGIAPMPPPSRKRTQPGYSPLVHTWDVEEVDRGGPSQSQARAIKRQRVMSRKDFLLAERDPDEPLPTTESGYDDGHVESTAQHQNGIDNHDVLVKASQGELLAKAPLGPVHLPSPLILANGFGEGASEESEESEASVGSDDLPNHLPSVYSKPSIKDQSGGKQGKGGSPQHKENPRNSVSHQSRLQRQSSASIVNRSSTSGSSGWGRNSSLNSQAKVADSNGYHETISPYRSPEQKRVTQDEALAPAAPNSDRKSLSLTPAANGATSIAAGHPRLDDHRIVEGEFELKNSHPQAFEDDGAKSLARIESLESVLSTPTRESQYVVSTKQQASPFEDDGGSRSANCLEKGETRVQKVSRLPQEHVGRDSQPTNGRQAKSQAKKRALVEDLAEDLAEDAEQASMAYAEEQAKLKLDRQKAKENTRLTTGESFKQKSVAGKALKKEKVIERAAALEAKKKTRETTPKAQNKEGKDRKTAGKKRERKRKEAKERRSATKIHGDRAASSTRSLDESSQNGSVQRVSPLSKGRGPELERRKDSSTSLFPSSKPSVRPSKLVESSDMTSKTPAPTDTKLSTQMPLPQKFPRSVSFIDEQQAKIDELTHKPLGPASSTSADKLSESSRRGNGDSNTKRNSPATNFNKTSPHLTKKTPVIPPWMTPEEYQAGLSGSLLSRDSPNLKKKETKLKIAGRVQERTKGGQTLREVPTSSETMATVSKGDTEPSELTISPSAHQPQEKRPEAKKNSSSTSLSESASRQPPSLSINGKYKVHSSPPSQFLSRFTSGDVDASGPSQTRSPSPSSSGTSSSSEEEKPEENTSESGSEYQNSPTKSPVKVEERPRLRPRKFSTPASSHLVGKDRQASMEGGAEPKVRDNSSKHQRAKQKFSAFVADMKLRNSSQGVDGWNF